MPISKKLFNYKKLGYQATDNLTMPLIVHRSLVNPLISTGELGKQGKSSDRVPESQIPAFGLDLLHDSLQVCAGNLKTQR